MFGKRSSTTSTSSSSSSEGAASSSCSPSPALSSMLKRSNSSTSSTSTESYRSETKRTVEFVTIAESEDYDDSGVKRFRLNSDDEPPPPEDDEDFVEQEDDDIGEEEEEDSHELRDEVRTLSDNEEDRYCSPRAAGGLSDSRSKFKSEPNLSTIVYEARHHDHQTNKEKKLSFLKSKLIKGVSMGNLRLPFGQDYRSGKKSSSTSLLKCCFEDNLRSAKKSLDGCSTGSVASMASPDYRLMGASPLLCKTKTFVNEYEQTNMMNENNANLEINAWNVGYLTSTPALSGRNSMSPITKSTQRMPKSMQVRIRYLSVRVKKLQVEIMYGMLLRKL